MEENEVVKIKLRRIFNVFHSRVYLWMLMYASIFAVYMIVSIRNDINDPLISLGVALFCISLAMQDVVLHCPKYLLIFEKRVEFEDYINMRPKNRMGKGFWWLKVHYSVSEIHDVEFHQNAIERLFNVGHISFSGKAIVTAKRDVDRIPEKDRFVIYGICNFYDFQRDFLY